MKVDELALKLIKGKKIGIDDIQYLRKYHMYDSTTIEWKSLSEQDIVNIDPRCLTPARKAWRTSLMNYGTEPTVDKLIMREGLK